VIMIILAYPMFRCRYL